MPDPKIGFHRISNTGVIVGDNFCTTEAIGEVSFERLVNECKKFQPNFLQEPLDYNVTEHAYVFFDLNYVKSKEICVTYLKSRGIIPHGRFGEWEYYNMDVCIKRSLDLAKHLREKYL
ncbi:hypothetical protein [Campylobacter troglodytis]|uniref:hypothetical protein n=1 Tax=Campylobacter troglodytis TaxID=654363 RepID=UPI001FE79699|nr:hypothetical protein [Campylobacter troglodytis]